MTHTKQGHMGLFPDGDVFHADITSQVNEIEGVCFVNVFDIYRIRRKKLMLLVCYVHLGNITPSLR